MTAPFHRLLVLLANGKRARQSANRVPPQKRDPNATYEACTVNKRVNQVLRRG